MKKVVKGIEPVELTSWRRNNPNSSYRDIDHTVRRPIRDACVKEQYSLCCYCGRRITLSTSSNEHITPQSVPPDLSLTFTNIVASCKTSSTCNAKRGNTPLGVSPLDSACESEVMYDFNGGVWGKTNDAQLTIDLTGLTAISQERNTLINSLLMSEGYDQTSILEEDTEMIEAFIESLNTPSNNLLSPFSPALVSILRSLIN